MRNTLLLSAACALLIAAPAHAQIGARVGVDVGVSPGSVSGSVAAAGDATAPDTSAVEGVTVTASDRAARRAEAKRQRIAREIRDSSRVQGGRGNSATGDAADSGRTSLAGRKRELGYTGGLSDVSASARARAVAAKKAERARAAAAQSEPAGDQTRKPSPSVPEGEAPRQE